MLTIWRFTDGKRGHENQSLALAEALCRLTPCRVETLPAAKGWPHLLSWLLGRFPPGKHLPKPDLIVGAGHATHWPMLAARRAHGGKIAVLMKPSLPLSWFDWVIAPAHDFAGGIPPSPPLSRGEPKAVPVLAEGAPPPPSPLSRGEPKAAPVLAGDAEPPASPLSSEGPKAYPLDKGGGERSEPGDSVGFCKRGAIIATQGPLNRIQPGSAQDERRGLMLIGGPSSEYGWSETALLKQIHLVALHRPEINWQLTTSRRTPAGFLADLARLGLPNVKTVAHEEVSPAWLPEQLAHAAQVWVTPDSASMVYEALTSGAAVGCFELPYARPGRVARGLEKLAHEKRLTLFSDWERSGKLQPNDQPLNEAGRCARQLLQCLINTPPPAPSPQGRGIIKDSHSSPNNEGTSLTRKLTIVQVLPALQSGGVERGTLEVGKYLVEHGHRSIVISAGGRMVEQLLREGSEHVSWDIGKKSLWTLRLVPKLRRFLVENKVDILHVRSRMPAWVCYLAWRGMDPQTRPRFVTTVHGPYSVNAYSAVMARGERVIVISEMIRAYVLKNYPATNPGKLRLIYRGVDPKAFPYGHKPDQAWLDGWYRQFPQTKGKKLIALPARITRWKGQEDFIDLLARLQESHPDIHGLIVGEAKGGKSRFLDELREKAARLGVSDRITFIGHRSDLREIMAISSVVLSLSREPEAFGRTTVEALSLGVPVIGYNHGGVGEQLAAILPTGAVTLNDIQAIASLIRNWLRQPPQIPQHQPFTLERMLNNTLNVYLELAQDQSFR